MKVRKLRWRFYKKTGGPKGWGLRCREYFEGCILCEFYKFYDEHGKFPSETELWTILDEIHEKQVKLWNQEQEIVNKE